MPQIEVRPSITNPTNKEEMYRQLYLALNEYNFGRVTFLELLEVWKEILQIPPSTMNSHQAQQEKV